MRATPKRVSLPYLAPVYVTVNLETGDVERVYMDDEAVMANPAAATVCVDTPDEAGVHDAEVIARAEQIADTVDWTSTEGRCQVWRGAWGGPADIINIFRAGLEAFEQEGFITKRISNGELVHISDVRAALRFLDDAATWDAEYDYEGQLGA